jgi:hypothetical protein
MLLILQSSLSSRHCTLPRCVSCSVGTRDAPHFRVAATSHGHKVADVGLVHAVVGDVSNRVDDAFGPELACLDDALERRAASHFLSLSFKLMLCIMKQENSMSSISSTLLPINGSFSTRKRFLSIPNTLSTVLRTDSHLTV